MVLQQPVDIQDLIQNGNHFYPDRIKFCVDKKRRKVAIDSEMHIDMEYELIDDGSNDKDLFGGDILIEQAPSYSIVWEAHPNIARNREYGYGVGRRLDNQRIKDELFDILTYWVR